MIVKNEYINNERFPIVVLIFFIITVFFILFYSIDKGIDLTDEGLYLALSQPTQENYFAQLNQKVIFDIFYNFFGISFGLIGLRILKFIFLIVSFMAFYPLLNYFKIKLFWKIFCFFGLFSQYAYFSQSLSYNTLAFFFYCLFFSFLFIYIFYSKNLLFVLFAGVFASFAFLAKSTTGLLLVVFGLLFCLLLTFKLTKKHEAVLIFSSFLVGFSIMQFAFGLSSKEYNFFQTILNGFDLSSYNSTHNTLALLKYPLSSFRWIIVLILAGYFIRISIQEKKLNFKIILFLLGLSLFFWFILSHDRLDIYRTYEFSFLALTYLLIGFSMTSIVNFQLEKKLLLFLILISPLIVSFGTNSYYFKGGVLYSFFPFLILAILNNNIDIYSNYIKYIGLLVIILITSKIFLNVIYMPFKQPQLLGSFTKYSYLTDKSIYLPDSYNYYLTDLKQIFEKYTGTTDKILGLYEMPGDILLAGRFHAINPCFWEPYQLEFYLKKARESGMLSEVKFVLSKEIFSPSDFYGDELQVLDSLNHPNFGKIYFTQINRHLDIR